MNRASKSKEVETAILTRMAASRVALLTANGPTPSVSIVRGQTRLRATGFLASLAEAPRVTLLLALCIGAIALGPRKTIRIVARSGITALLAGAARKVVAHAV